MLHKQATIEEMRAAFEASWLPPEEDFARMVRNGLINCKGQLTKLFGGQADPEPGAKRPVPSGVEGPSVRDSNGEQSAA